MLQLSLLTARNGDLPYLEASLCSELQGSF